MNKERREIISAAVSEAKFTAAELYPFQKPQICEKWVKAVWYGDDCGGKIIVFKAGNPYLKKEGVRKGSQNISEDEQEKARLAQSLSRTRRRIFEIAACNPWEWFFTGTLDGEKVDRKDLNATFKKLSQWLRDYRKKQSGERVTYLIVPEQHKNGAWHFHGLINGISENELHRFSVDEKIPLRIKRTIKAGTDVFSWSAYSEKFGYSTMTKVRDNNAVACYVTKYITKDMIAENRAIEGGRHLYYASRGLAKPECLAEGYPITEYAPCTDYGNDYVQILTVKNAEDMNNIINHYGLKRG